MIRPQPISASSDMRPVLSFPVLEGMTYPQPESANLVRRVKHEAELLSLPAAARAGVVLEALGWGTENRKRQEREAQDGKAV